MVVQEVLQVDHPVFQAEAPQEVHQAEAQVVVQEVHQVEAQVEAQVVVQEAHPHKLHPSPFPILPPKVLRSPSPQAFLLSHQRGVVMASSFHPNSVSSITIVPHCKAATVIASAKRDHSVEMVFLTAIWESSASLVLLVVV